MPECVFCFFLLFSSQHKQCWAVWGPLGIHSPGSVPSHSWDRCVWSKVQHSPSRRRYGNIFPLLKRGEETFYLTKFNEQTSIQCRAEQRACVSTINTRYFQIHDFLSIFGNHHQFVSGKWGDNYSVSVRESLTNSQDNIIFSLNPCKALEFSPALLQGNAIRSV